jgi:nucleoside-diphosphate-sugar epimerase
VALYRGISSAGKGISADWRQVYPSHATFYFNLRFAERIPLGVVFITGASGFVGSVMVQACQHAGFSVRATSRNKPNRLSTVEYIQSDLLNLPSLMPAIQGADCVIHAAGLAHQFGQDRHAAAQFMAVNVDGTVNLMQAAARANVPHVVLIGSVAVYGSPSIPICNETQLCRPDTPYAQSKYQAELRAAEIAQAHHIRLTVLRLATVYGEGDPGNVARLMRAIDRGHFVWIGTGSNQKSLIHRDDVARAGVSVLMNLFPESDVQIYNVSAPPCTMREVVDELVAALKRHPLHWRVPAAPILAVTKLIAKMVGRRDHVGALYDTLRKWLNDDVYDASKFNRTFNFQTQISLAEGLGREVAWYRSIV